MRFIPSQLYLNVPIGGGNEWLCRTWEADVSQVPYSTSFHIIYISVCTHAI